MTRKKASTRRVAMHMSMFTSIGEGQPAVGETSKTGRIDRRNSSLVKRSFLLRIRSRMNALHRRDPLNMRRQCGSKGLSLDQGNGVSNIGCMRTDLRT